MEQVNIYGQVFTREIYDFLMNSFKESFSHASLSVERAFEEVKNCEITQRRMKDEKSYEYYQLLSNEKKKEIDEFLKYCTICRGHQFGILVGTFDPNISSEKVEELFRKHFPYMLEDMHYILRFTKDGELDKRETFMDTREMFRTCFEKQAAQEKAKNMEKDHRRAFDYALGLKEIGIKEIIKINELVNHSDPNREVGFKKTDNMITGSSIHVEAKESTPYKMQELLRDYQNNHDLEIKDYKEENISTEEKHKRLLSLYEKEALFHIHFIKIHPFADGNGRTARILTNKHLIDQGLPPVLITNYMIEEYKECISSIDYKGLAKMMLASSSQLLSNWVSIQKLGVFPTPEEGISSSTK